ncbi:hypothetical protein CSEC_0883 [Criblamydia sequanensis CRIB-18]|uniref:Uncharacterized protein n=1 Tax=Candidatus Criblamydia sequanensis CRIB-18 TaxID=1437425 RepID=A0A090CYS3_9BACT|nr:hypothetical protein CSEC_0883 [Criblamydia sequanensis CRIB-18]
MLFYVLWFHPHFDKRKEDTDKVSDITIEIFFEERSISCSPIKFQTSCGKGVSEREACIKDPGINKESLAYSILA